ncbi:MAG TPA: flagellar hook-basal body complex protein [Clostridia bacterium]|nr:flagellar hook-basal body complex protein [Clostridia bacterium]
MMRSLYSGVTGLRNHQTRMDVIGNNISNVNTVGYKSSRVIFQDLFSQTLSSATGGSGTVTGGTNPKQVGLGSALASIDILNTESATQYTGNTLDLSITGDGYFAVTANGVTTYTRAGNFYTDENNYLVTATGAFLQGFTLQYDPVLDADGDPVMNPDGTPAMQVRVDGEGNPVYSNTLTRIQIDPNLKSVSIGDTGIITALNGSDKVIVGQIALATFSNNNGLEKVGSNTYRPSDNSGAATYTTPGDGAGKLSSGTLEMSNVDLAAEFTDMIVTQRGFQANSRIITTTDTMLEELVNLKR